VARDLLLPVASRKEIFRPLARARRSLAALLRRPGSPVLSPCRGVEHRLPAT